MTELRVPLIIGEPLTEGAPNLRVPLVVTEPLTEGAPALRVPLVVTEPLTEGMPNLRAPLVITEPLTEGAPNLRVSLFFIETLIPVPPEEIMVDAILPGFGNSLADASIPEAANPASGATPGLAFSVHMKPMFNTRVSTSVNLKSIRTQLAPVPKWAFDLPYEFLEDRTGAGSSLHTLTGFFCARGGSALPFLVKVPDFYLASNAMIGTADATRLQWDFKRWVGAEYSEPVGQVDTVNAVSIFITPAESAAVPGAGPYTITVAHAAAFVADVSVTHSGVPLVKVSGVPATGQYSVVAGVYTFNAAQAGQTMVITYRWLVDPADYTVTMPNKLVFDVAPVTGAISWSGQFFFTCYFDQDEADFEKFYDKLWALQSLTFHSELLA
jgi:hypothetical protein